jgi:hypothetical protein
MKLTPKLVRTLAPGQDPSKVERIDASKQGVIKVRCALGLRSVPVALSCPPCLCSGTMSLLNCPYRGV